MQTGTFERASLMYFSGVMNDTITIKLYHAKLVVNSSGFAEIVHYIGADKLPDNKRTLIIPANSVINFVGLGYAK